MIYIYGSSWCVEQHQPYAWYNLLKKHYKCQIKNYSFNGVSFDSTYTVGTSTCILYPGGTVATGSTTGYDIFNFVGVNTTGSAADITNYNFLSVKNGDFRLYA